MECSADRCVMLVVEEIHVIENNGISAQLLTIYSTS